MAKVKERKSESWKPGVHHDDGFISKNKKRKDKRMSLNLSAKKIDTDEFIPIKKSFLALHNKSKDGSKSTPTKFLSPALDKKQTPKKRDTPLPVLGGKKPESTSNLRKFSIGDSQSAILKMLNGAPKGKKEPTGTPKVKTEPAGTPKVKIEPIGTPKIKSEFAGSPKKKSAAAGTPKVNLEPVIKSSLKKKAQKFIDHEAEEGEEPITDEQVKPYVKGQKRKSISFRLPNDSGSDSDSDDSGDSDDSEEMTSARDFLDSEASEGEETDDSDVGVSNDDDSNNEDEDSEDDDDDSDGSDFLAGGDNDDDDSSDEEGEEDDSDEQDSDDSDEELLPKLQANKKQDNKAKTKKNVVEEDSDDSSDDEIAEQPSKPKQASAQIKKEKIEKTPKLNEPVAKKSKMENDVQKPIKEVKKLKEGKATGDTIPPVTTEYAGYIKFLPNSITADQIKAQLGTTISPKNIVSIVLKKNNTKKSNKCLVYVKDEDTLDKLENKTYTIGETNFKVFKARESKKPEKTQPLAFLPRVPLSIDNDKLKSTIAADIGAGNIKNLKSKKVNDKLKTRNVLIEVANEEILKKIIYKGSYSCNGVDIVVRQAFESGFQIPIYKIVFSGIPENTTEALIKKAVEIKIGKGSVVAVKFSFRKKSFAFVTLNNEQAQKKLLDPSVKITVNGTKLETVEFKPRKPSKKRGPSKKKPKEAPPAKKQKVDPQSSSEAEPKKPKNKKKSPKVDTSANSPGKNQQNSQQQKKPKQQSQNNVPDSPQQKNQSQNAPKKQRQQPQQTGSPQQKNQLKKQKQQQQPASNQASPSSPKKNKKAKKAHNHNQPQTPDKKANLSNKLEAKKEKLKNKKNKKKQADTSN